MRAVVVTLALGCGGGSVTHDASVDVNDDAGHSPPSFRYAYFSSSDPAANAALGVTLIDVGSRSSADALPTALRGMVWIGDYDNTSCAWQVDDATVMTKVTAAAGDAKVAGWFFSDEPDPITCPGAPAQHRARNDLVHAADPATKTFITLDSNGFTGNLTQDAIDQIPLWVGAADYIGLDPYPCLSGSACDDTFIPRMIAKADSAGIPYVGILQAFDGTPAGEEFRLPTAAELQQMIDVWRNSAEVGTGFFAWEWPDATWQLSAHPDLEAVIHDFFTAP